jgi:hypothetical protein
MRVALVLLLINGLVPALGEVAEAAAHFAVVGHLAHTAADRGDLGEQGREHGCGTTEHHCACCASQVLAVEPGRLARTRCSTALRLLGSDQRLASLHEPAPPYRPPIAS